MGARDLYPKDGRPAPNMRMKLAPAPHPILLFYDITWGDGFRKDFKIVLRAVHGAPRKRQNLDNPVWFKLEDAPQLAGRVQVGFKLQKPLVTIGVYTIPAIELLFAPWSIIFCGMKREDAIDAAAWFVFTLFEPVPQEAVDFEDAYGYKGESAAAAAAVRGEAALLKHRWFRLWASNPQLELLGPSALRLQGREDIQLFRDLCISPGVNAYIDAHPVALSGSLPQEPHRYVSRWTDILAADQRIELYRVMLQLSCQVLGAPRG